MVDVTIKETDEYELLVSLFMKNELEFSEEEPVPTDLVKCWKAEQDGVLIGGCALALREGRYIIDGIAVEPEYRKSEVGKKLLQTALAEIRERGGKELYLVARAPGFFARQGFLTVERKDAPTFFECFTCPQYQKTCFPEVMKLSLDQLEPGV